jgi:nucleoside-diphosphate-sugar epimerase
MASLLVIGGSGFFGKSILDAFQRNLLDSWDIDSLMIMARHPEELQKNHSQLITSKVKLLKGDITSINELPFADYVIHAAASSDARNYLTSPFGERSNIIMGTLNYCELARKFHQKSKIVYVSSGAVYGPQPYNLEKIDEDFVFLDADQLAESKRDYVLAKRESESLVKRLANNGLNVSIARCFAFVGKWLPRNQHFAIGNFIADILSGKSIEVKASHRVYRSYMYADDLVIWLMSIMYNSSAECPIFNVGSDQAIHLRDLAFMLGKSHSVGIIMPSINNVTIDRYVPSITKAKEELGLGLKFNLAQSINETLFRLRD